MTNLHEALASDLTLTPGTDGGSDYHQYLEKTSRGNSRGNASLVHSSPTRDGENLSHNTYVNTPAPTLYDETRLEISGVPTLERMRPTHACTQREQRPQRLELTQDSHEYPGPFALSLLTVGICLSVFLVSLDRTIVATVRAPYEPLLPKRLD